MNLILSQNINRPTFTLTENTSLQRINQKIRSFEKYQISPKNPKELAFSYFLKNASMAKN
jgi:hypothetical protein